LGLATNLVAHHVKVLSEAGLLERIRSATISLALTGLSARDERLTGLLTDCLAIARQANRLPWHSRPDSTSAVAGGNAGGLLR
jgi:hypothetical protein